MVACLRIGNAQQRRSAGHRGQGPTGLRDRGAGWNPPPSLRPGHGRASFVLTARRAAVGCGAAPAVTQCGPRRAVRRRNRAQAGRLILMGDATGAPWAAGCCPRTAVPAATRVGLLGGAGRPFGCRRGIESEGPLLDAGGRLIVAGNDGAHRFDHVVSVMFENRSFDNLLGYLYDPGEVASFEGVAASCPTPSRATPRTPTVGWCRCTWRPRWTRQPRRRRGAPPHQHPAVRDRRTSRQPVPVL